MVSSTTRKIISLAISLLVVVISLTGVALGATVPTVSTLSRYTPAFAGAPGKMVRDTAGNFYVTDFWGKGIVKLNRQGNKIGFIATSGRPSAVAVLADNRLVVAMSKPQAYVAFYSQIGSAPDVTGAEGAQFGAPAQPLFNPTGITVDATGYIYVVDSGDTGSTSNPNPATINVGKVRVYSSTGAYLFAFGTRTAIGADGGSFAALGAFKMPMGIAYEKESTNIVVADTMNQRLQFFKNYAVDPLCTPVKYFGDPAGFTVGQPIDNNTTVVRFGDPTDIAFEYSGTALNRIYVAERSKGDVVVVDPVTAFSLVRINGTNLPSAEMKYPSGIVFEKTTTGGVLYANSAATSSGANILPLSIDLGAIPVPAFTMTMAAVPATSAVSPITVNGTISIVNPVTCSVNSGTGVAATGSWTAGLTLQNGYNYILCQSTSGGVTVYTEARTYYTLTPGTAPTVAISQPSAGLYTNASSVTVTGTSDTANATVQLVNSLNSFTTTTQTGADKKWSAVVNIAETSNIITATAWTQGSNTSAPVTVTVVRDTTPPGVNISFLGNAATTNKAVQNLDGVVLEANLSSITVNGLPVPASEMVTMAGNNTYFSV